MTGGEVCIIHTGGRAVWPQSRGRIKLFCSYPWTQKTSTSIYESKNYPTTEYVWWVRRQCNRVTCTCEILWRVWCNSGVSEGPWIQRRTRCCFFSHLISIPTSWLLTETVSALQTVKGIKFKNLKNEKCHRSRWDVYATATFWIQFIHDETLERRLRFFNWYAGPDVSCCYFSLRLFLLWSLEKDNYVKITLGF